MFVSGKALTNITSNIANKMSQYTEPVNLKMIKPVFHSSKPAEETQKVQIFMS